MIQEFFDEVTVIINGEVINARAVMQLHEISRLRSKVQVCPPQGDWWSYRP
jgi:hypothetical protein